MRIARELLVWSCLLAIGGVSLGMGAKLAERYIRWQQTIESRVSALEQTRVVEPKPLTAVDRKRGRK